MTAIGLIPAAIEQLHLAVIPEWLMIAGLSASFFSFIYTGWSAADGKEVKSNERL